MKPWVNTLLVIYCLGSVGLSIFMWKKYRHKLGCGIWAFNALGGLYLLIILNLL